MLAATMLYLGPGLGGGVIAMIIAFLVSLLTFLVAIVWYPIKKIVQVIKKRRNK
jgi:F0F1-type ATP synthase membrane subunit b/b'